MAASDRASEAVHPDDRPRVLETWQAAIVEKRPFAMEYRVRRHDGVYVPMAVRGSTWERVFIVGPGGPEGVKDP